MGTHFFAYGTLMIPELLTLVCGASFRSLPASLQGYTRYALRGVSYPGVIAEPQGVTEGRLYLDLSHEQFSRLDRFEGRWYQRQPVQAQSGGQTLPAVAYVLDPEHRHLITGQPWDPREFRERHFRDFVVTYAGFSQIDD